VIGTRLNILVFLLAVLLTACHSQVPAKAELRPDAQRWEASCKQGHGDDCFSLGVYLLKEENVGADDAEAVVALELGCNAGSASACGLLGTVYLSLNKGSEDARAMRLLEQACSRNVALACHDLAEVTFRKSTFETTELAIRLLGKACQLNDLGSCFTLGALYAEGRGVSRNKIKAGQWFEQGCIGGSGVSCFALANIMDDLGPVDLGRHERLVTRGCELGHGHSCAWLASQFVNPRQNLFNCPKAVPLAERACREKSAEGCALVAICLARNQPSDLDGKDSPSAWCERGVATACYYVASEQLKRSPSEVDIEYPLRLLSQACKQHDMTSCRLSLTVLRGHPSRTTPLLELLRTVETLCDHNQADACLFLAELYEKGDPVALDADRARELRARACRMGDNNACGGTPSMSSTKTQQ
jgi:TPR repeat protein